MAKRLMQGKLLLVYNVPFRPAAYGPVCKPQRITFSTCSVSQGLITCLTLSFLVWLQQHMQNLSAKLLAACMLHSYATMRVR